MSDLGATLELQGRDSTMCIRRIDHNRFEELSYTHDRPVEEIIAVTNKGEVVAYAWSPDGQGAYWFDTIEELKEDIGLE